MQGRATNFANVLSLPGAFVATARGMALLAAGLMIPAVGATGSAAKSSVEMFDSLPGEFSTSPLAQQSKIYDARGGLITTPYDEIGMAMSRSAGSLFPRLVQASAPRSYS